MTLGETRKLLETIEAAWWNFEVNEQSLEIWHQGLKDLDYPTTEAALMKQICISAQPPSIEKLQSEIMLIQTDYKEYIPEKYYTWEEICDPKNEDEVREQFIKLYEHQRKEGLVTQHIRDKIKKLKRTFNLKNSLQ